MAAMTSHPHWTFGDLSLQRVVESEGPLLSPFEIFPDCTQAHLDANRDWLVPRFQDAAKDGATGLLTIAIQSFLVRRNGLTILVDSCSGNDKEARARPQFRRAQWPWLERLRQAGVAPADIDIVLCSHLHVDHVGWNTRLDNGRWVPTFPKARYLISRREWEHWQAAGAKALERTGDYITDSVLPVFAAGQAELVADEHAVAAGVSVEPAPGHTPGQMMVRLGQAARAGRRAGSPLRRPDASPAAGPVSGMEHAFLHRSGRGARDAGRLLQSARGHRPADLPGAFPDSDRRQHRS
jgi:glyoxylase-like metal-dependent hydrolase (beta-lactamase superfamily II)